MSEGADVDRLTPRTDAVLTEIWSKPHDPDHYVPPKMIEHARQLERELSALSQEAVRDEALEEAAKIAEPKSGDPQNDWERGYWAAENTISRDIRALKREPNAAAQDRSTERASGERTSAGTSPSPAPAAPDVASMVKRLRGCVNDRHDPAVTTCEDIEPLALEAAALLAKLGQGWVPETIWLCSNGDGAKHAFLKDPSGPCPFCQKNGKGNWSVYPLPLLGTPGASDD